MYYCIVNNINDIQQDQLNAFLFKFLCKHNPCVMLPVGDFSIKLLYTLIYLIENILITQHPG